MAALADIGYPAGDEALEPVRDQLVETWLRPSYFEEFECTNKAAAYRSGTGGDRDQLPHAQCRA